MNTFKKWHRVGFSALMCLLVSGCDKFTNDGLRIGGTVEAADSNGVCGEYLGFKVKHLVRDYSDGKLYSFGNYQPLVHVDECWDLKTGNRRN